MDKLTVVILTKDEERNIGRVINSAKCIADEILVIDSGSKDRTIDIAQSLGARVIKNPWKGFSSQRNFGIEQSKNDWILILDADEKLSNELCENIKKELENPKYSAYELSRKTYYLGRFLEHTWYPEWRLRLFKKGVLRFEGDLHETPVLQRNIDVGRLKGDLYHYSYRDLYHQYIKTVDYARLMALSYHRTGKRFRFYKLMLNPFLSFLKVYVFKFGFLDGWRGLLVAASSFFYVFLKYIFLYELELKEKYGEDLWK